VAYSCHTMFTRSVMVATLLVGGCATKRAAHVGMATGGAVAVGGFVTMSVVLSQSERGCGGGNDCFGQSGALVAIGLITAGAATLAVSVREAAKFDQPSPAERAAILTARAQRDTLVGKCDSVESTRHEIVALEGGNQLVVQYDRTPSIERCLTSIRRKRNQSIAWEVTKVVAQRARAGDCAGAIAAGPQVLGLDAEFHRVVYLGDAAIRGCLQRVPLRTRSTVDVLMETATQRAEAGDCATVRVIRERVLELDAQFHDHVFVMQPALATCLAP
jgi:hypothetical protein